jgi:queuine tRNA-ribosyltransferase
MDITHRWAARSLVARGESPQSLFGIVQGALYEELRRESAAALTEMPFDGFAIGGLAVGEGKSEREDTCEFTASLLPSDRPRYLMGVGTPLDILEAVHRGVDMFDCVLPSRVARNGLVFTPDGPMNLKNEKYRTDPRPIVEGLDNYTCRNFSRAYLRHLTVAGEILASTLCTLHNLHFYLDLMTQARAHIEAGDYATWHLAWVARYEAGAAARLA